jgi:uncharacterized membrane protein
VNDFTAAAQAVLERRVAVVLQAGTWLASLVIAVGLVVPSGAHVVMLGVALFIALPILRGLLMLIAFFRAGDWRIAGVAALVLAVIGLAIALTMHTGGAAG